MSMRRIAMGTIVTVLAVMTAAQAAVAAPVQSGSSSTQPLTSRGSTVFTPTAPNPNYAFAPRLNTIERDAAAATPVTNRSLSRGHKAKQRAALTAPVVSSSSIAGGPANLTTSFNGLNLYDQATTDGFALEPPDQGLCVGNGYALESVNDVLRVYRTDGSAASSTTDLNVFYHYPTYFQGGPFVTDPTCYFDPDNGGHFFHVILTLDLDNSGNFTGGNHLDIAVSQTNNPLGTWNLYSIQVANDGSLNTPKHTNCPCIGDYPHIGADAYGFYITTNEYPFFADGFNGAQLYAMSKKALAIGAANPRVTQFENLVLEKARTTGFTVWPAIAPPGQSALNNGGTEYFLSSMAAQEAQGQNYIGFDNRLGVWALTNTQSLDSANPDVDLSSRDVAVETYGIPPASDQKPGAVPLADCLNAGCFGTDPYHEVEGPLDSSDTRMQQVAYANGLLYGALDTVVNVAGQEKAGIAYFVIKPAVIGNGKHVGPQATVIKQGYVALANNNVIYPAIAVLANGKGVMALNVVGRDYYPSAGYTTLDASSGAGTIQLAAAGIGPQDGFTEYRLFGDANGNNRPRWGDYGAAALDGDQIWIASEYIGQTCSFAAFLQDTTCGGTRIVYGNWGTRISAVRP